MAMIMREPLPLAPYPAEALLERGDAAVETANQSSRSSTPLAEEVSRQSVDLLTVRAGGPVVGAALAGLAAIRAVTRARLLYHNNLMGA
jgi:hypothetical protein